ncbi:hypothetical protein HDV00_005135 [Rhizophlyctis rosea]|nr:hypothetical protein HDV00_005135 [Rhizophlyctis rosea]
MADARQRRAALNKQTAGLNQADDAPYPPGRRPQRRGSPTFWHRWAQILIIPLAIAAYYFLKPLIHETKQRQKTSDARGTSPLDTLWPLPAKIVHSQAAIVPLTFWNLRASGGGSEEASRYVSKAFLNANANVRKVCPGWKPAEAKGSIEVVLKKTQPVGPEYLDESVSDAYELDTTQAGVIRISADNAYGALRAAQTLSQLVVNVRGVCGYWWNVKIEDQPRFPYRGFMLDTSRNFFSVKDILRTLDGLAETKLNVFHWHVIDAQSFPLKWEYDGGKLYKAGAYKRPDGSLKVYSREDVDKIINYAHDRGIRVVPEVNCPGFWGEIFVAFIRD